MLAWKTGYLRLAITSVCFIGVWHLSLWTRRRRLHSLIHAALFWGAPGPCGKVRVTSRQADEAFVHQLARRLSGRRIQNSLSCSRAFIMNSPVTDLLEIIVCPRDKQLLREAGDFLLCPKAHRYRVVEGIPILLVSEAQQTHIEGDRALLVWGSRMPVWDRTMSSLHAHPWF